ncbi:MAG: hypothetical protein ACE5GB_14255 [Acidimicrobiales bacterium]
MTSIVLLVLVAAWGAYLFLWWKDGRVSVPSRRDDIRGFNRSLGSLADTSARSVGSAVDVMGRGAELARMPRTAIEAARRRREVFLVLGALAGATLLAVPLLGSRALAVSVFVDALLLAYAWAVVRRQHLNAEREMKVRMLYPDRPASAEAELVSLGRTATG